jgi:hypothetical protein
MHLKVEKAVSCIVLHARTCRWKSSHNRWPRIVARLYQGSFITIKTHHHPLRNTRLCNLDQSPETPITSLYSIRSPLTPFSLPGRLSIHPSSPCQQHNTALLIVQLRHTPKQFIQPARIPLIIPLTHDDSQLKHPARDMLAPMIERRIVMYLRIRRIVSRKRFVCRILRIPSSLNHPQDTGSLATGSPSST